MELLTIDEASNYLKIEKSTLYSWVHKKKITYRKHGRKLIFVKNDLKLFSDNRAVKPMDCSTTNNVKASRLQRRSLKTDSDQPLASLERSQ